MNTPADQTPREPPGQDATAAEYALGVLGVNERRAAERRMLVDPGFAREIADWQAHLAPLIDEIAEVAPPPALWPRIRSAIGVVERSRTAQDKQIRINLWQSVPFWRWLSAGALAAAAASLVALFLARQAAVPPAPAPLVARLVADNGAAVFIATVNPRLGTLVVQPVQVSIPAGRAAELWLIPPGGAPQSLGLLDPARPNAVVVPRQWVAELGPRALFAVSVEPPAGAPHAKPSGPIIAKGEIAVL